MMTNAWSSNEDETNDACSGDGSYAVGDRTGGGRGCGVGTRDGDGGRNSSGDGAGIGYEGFMLFNPRSGDFAAEVIYANIFGARS